MLNLICLTVFKHVFNCHLKNDKVWKIENFFIQMILLNTFYK